jgi:hypothetical protein
MQAELATRRIFSNCRDFVTGCLSLLLHCRGREGGSDARLTAEGIDILHHAQEKPNGKQIEQLNHR